MLSNQPNFVSADAQELQLQGNCGFDIQNDRAIVHVGAIANQRPWGDLSGTLSLELWALKQPYHGEGFNGVALAGTCVGEISGQHFIPACSYDLDFKEPPAGTWHLVLMLREWGVNGFETRDYMNFAVPYVARWIPAVVPGKANNVVNVSFNDGDKLEQPKAEVKAAEAKVAERGDAELQAESAKHAGNIASADSVAKVGKVETAQDKKQKETLVKEALAKDASAKAAAAAPAVKSEAKPVAKAEGKAAVKAAAKTATAVSLNRASLEEIASLKGVSRGLAEKIVAARPFLSLEQVLKVSGMGAKLMKKLEGQVSL